MSKITKRITGILLTILVSSIISLSIFLISSLDNVEAFQQNPFYKFDTAYAILFILKTIIFIFVFRVFLYLRRYEKTRKEEIMNKIPGAVIIYDFMGKIIYINDFVKKIFGYKKEEVVGQSILMFLSKKDKQRAIFELKDDVKNKFIRNPIASWTLIASDKKEIDSIINFSYYDKKSIIAICMDNTQIIEAKKSYSQQVQFFWSLLNDLPTPISYRDTEGVYKFVNTAFQKYMNIKEVDILGKKINFAVKKDEFERFETKRKLALETKQEVVFEDISSINDKKKILHFEIVPRIVNGDIMGTFITFKDITSEKIKEGVLKRDIILNKTINEISEIMISSNLEKLDDNINTALNKVKDAFKADRVFILTQKDDRFYIKYEVVENGIKSHINHIFDMDNDEFNFCKNLILKNGKVASSRISISQLFLLNHIKYFNSKSAAEVGTFVDNDINGILCVISENKQIVFEAKEIDFLKSISNSIFGTIARVQQMYDLKLSEETLNTLIDNTKIGIIITDFKNNIKFINDKACFLLDVDKHVNEIEFDKYVSDEYVDIVKKAFKEREYKGSCDLNLKLKSNNLVEFYCSKINYESSKAYLITLVDINKYI